MNVDLSSLRENLRHRGAAYLVLAISLLSTAALYFQLERHVTVRERRRFEEAGQVLFKRAELHLDYHVDVLRGVRGMFWTGQAITAEGWKKYFRSYHLQQSHPGILDVGYVMRVPANEKEKHVAGLREQGNHAYQVLPEGDRPVYFPIIYLEDVRQGPQTPTGWDAASETRRSAAMDQAMDTGQPVSTGKVEIYSYNWPVETGFIVYLPVYRGGLTPPTVSERRSALEGFVFGSFSPAKLWAGVGGPGAEPGVDLEIFDGAALARENLLYDGNGVFHGDGRAWHSGQIQADAMGRRWSFFFSTTPAFELDSRRQWPRLALFAGLLISALLFGIAGTQVKARLASEQLSADLRRSEEVLRKTNEQLHAQILDGERAKDALRGNEMRLRALVNGIDDVVFEIDRHGIYLNVWTTNEEVLLKPKRDVVGHGVGEFVEKDLADRFHQLLERTLATGKSENIEYCLDLRAGRRWFLARISPILTAEGPPQSVCMLARDITERKNAEEMLVQSQSRLQLFNNVLAVGASGQGFEDTIVTALRQIGQCFPSVQACFASIDARGQWHVHHSVEPSGWPSLQGRSIDLTAAPEYLAAVRRRESVVTRAVVLDARCRPVADVLAAHGIRALLHLPFRDAGAELRLIGLHSPAKHEWSTQEIGTLQEIVEYLSISAQQHEAQKNRWRAEQALAAEKERLSVTLRSIADGVITTDTRGQITMVNRVAEQLTGWSQEEAIGRPLDEIFHLIHEKTRQPVEHPVARVLAAGEIFGLATNTMLVARDASERLISNSGAPILDGEGRTIGVVLVFRDITDRQKLELELLKASKIESLGLLAGGIAHDFNNILTGILGNVSLARMFSPPEGDIQERLAQAEKACLRAKDLTQQLLNFSKGGSPIPKAASIGDLLQDSVEFALRGSKVRPEISLAPDLWPVEVDVFQMGQVASTLTMNAAEALPNGGIIKVQAENVLLNWHSLLPLPEGKYVRIAFEDDGPSIRPEQLSRIFDPYFSTKQRASGLVLATAYAIVKKHGGLIRAESEAGARTTFEVFLPAAARAPAVRPEKMELPPEDRRRILVMDDDPQILDLAQAVLTRLGYQIELSKDGLEAVERFAAARNSGQPFGAVILDLTVPGAMGGREAVERISAIDPKVRAIVSSGYPNDPVMANFREFGFTAFVSKPYQIDELAETLQQVLRT